MNTLQVNLIRIGHRLMMLFLVAALASFAIAQNSKNAPAKSDLTGHYEGSAKNNAGENIDVALDLAEKDGVLSGMIHSSHGDFTISGGSHKGEDVSLEFDAGGPTGTITLKSAEDKLSGTWSAGDDGGSLEVKKAAAKEGDAKGKS
jgi:hypothetical protein